MDDDIPLAPDATQPLQGASTQGTLWGARWHKVLLSVLICAACFCFAPMTFGQAGAKGPAATAVHATPHLKPVAPEPLVQCTPEYVRLAKVPLIRSVRSTAPHSYEALLAQPALTTVLDLPELRFRYAPLGAAQQCYGHRGPIYFSLPPPAVCG